MTVEEEVLEDLKAFDGYAVGGQEAKAQTQIYIDLESVEAGVLRRRYSEALSMLHESKKS